MLARMTRGGRQKEQAIELGTVHELLVGTVSTLSAPNLNLPGVQVMGSAEYISDSVVI